MMEVKVKKVKINEIKLNPDNPRKISEKNMDRLIKSLQEFPEMMELREIVVDETMTVLGGNMRLLSLRKLGVKNCIAKIVSGLTPDQKRQFIIKDNAVWGEWDFDVLLDEWKDLPLDDWGIFDLLKPLNGSVEEKLEQKQVELKPYKKIHVLISIDVCKMENKIIELLDQLKKIEGIEIEQSAN